jgi:GntR family transcriptional regulator
MDRTTASLHLSSHDRRRDEARRLRDLINTGLERSLGRPARLPDERLIAEGFGMSRNGVREALNLLAEEGRIERNVGAGSFARVVPARKPFDRIVDFSKAEHDLPVDTSSSAVGFRTLTSVPETMRQALGLSEGVSLAIFERVVWREGVPIELRTYFLPLCRGEEMTAADVQRDVYEVIEAGFGRLISGAHRAVSAVAADPSSAALLRVRPGSPLLFMESTLVDTEGRVVLVTYGRHRSDHVTVTFAAERIRPVTTGRRLPAAGREGAVSECGCVSPA